MKQTLFTWKNKKNNLLLRIARNVTESNKTPYEFRIFALTRKKQKAHNTLPYPKNQTNYG